MINSVTKKIESLIIGHNDDGKVIYQDRNSLWRPLTPCEVF